MTMKDRFRSETEERVQSVGLGFKLLLGYGLAIPKSTVSNTIWFVLAGKHSLGMDVPLYKNLTSCIFKLQEGFELEPESRCYNEERSQASERILNLLKGEMH